MRQPNPARRRTKKMVVIGTPFIIPYRAQNDQLEILIVLHGARKSSEKL
jgi:plasmid stabilization system protein ParE